MPKDIEEQINYQNRTDILDAIHKRIPMPCSGIVRARKGVVAYPSYKDRIRYDLGRVSKNLEDRAAIRDLIHEISNPISGLLTGPRQMFRDFRIRREFNESIARLDNSINAASDIDTKDYAANALGRFIELRDKLYLRGFKSLRDAESHDLQLNADESDGSRIRLRWEQYTHNHTFQIIEDCNLAPSGDHANCALQETIFEFNLDAFTSLSEHLAPPTTDNDGVRGNFRQDLLDALCHATPEKGKQGRQFPDGGILSIADYWIVPIDSYLSTFGQYDVETAKSIDAGKEELKRNAQLGNVTNGMSKNVALTLHEIFKRAREWLKISAGLNGSYGQDIVYTFLNDRRAVLISDLRPDPNLNGERKFTDFESRSIIIDFGMSEEERGRVLQRLMDIAAFRHLGLFGIQYASDSLNLITHIGMERNKIGNSRNLRASKKLLLLQQFSLALDSLNHFYTYGVSGRAASAARFSREIRKNLKLLREDRIPGNQTLSGYLERYYVVVDKFDILRSRYRDIRVRIDETATLLKVEFDVKQSRFLIFLALIGTLVAVIELAKIFGWLPK